MNRPSMQWTTVSSHSLWSLFQSPCHRDMEWFRSYQTHFRCFRFYMLISTKMVKQQYLIDSVMRDVNPVCFFDLLLRMDGTRIVGTVAFKDYLFSDGIKWSRSSPGRFEFRIHLNLFETRDGLIYPLSGNLEIPSNICNAFLFLPLPYDSPVIPIR